MLIYLTSVNEIAVSSEAAQQEQWIRDMARQNTAALERLYENTKAAVYGFALSLLKNTHDAEDVLQDCFVQIYAAAPEYRAAGKPLAWILTITRNLCLQRLRERRRTAELPEEDWQPYLERCDSLSQDDRLVLEACLGYLKDEERHIVLLHAVAGFKHREIAALLDLPLATVLSKYTRTLRKLKHYCEGGRKR